MDNANKQEERAAAIQKFMPNAEQVLTELSSAKSMDDFFGKDGIFSRLFARTMEAMLEAEMSEQLERYEAKGRGSGNNRNGHNQKTVRTTSGGETVKELSVSSHTYG